MLQSAAASVFDRSPDLTRENLKIIRSDQKFGFIQLQIKVCPSETGYNTVTVITAEQKHLELAEVS